MGRVRHPGDKAVSFSGFLSCNSAYNITLRCDSCLCSPCYVDCLRAKGKPRWLSLSKHLVCRHCMLCCHGPLDCSCDGVEYWGSMQWYQSGDELNSWVQYFRACGENVVDNEHSLCMHHYNKMRQTARTRTCKVCATASSVLWHVGTAVMEAMGSLKDTCEFGELDWVCDECCTTLVYP